MVTGILHFAHAEPGVVFAVAAAALGGLAGAISIAIESRGECFGPAVSGALQSTFGNLSEPSASSTRCNDGWLAALWSRRALTSRVGLEHRPDVLARKLSERS